MGPNDGVFKGVTPKGPTHVPLQLPLPIPEVVTDAG